MILFKVLSPSATVYSVVLTLYTMNLVFVSFVIVEGTVNRVRAYMDDSVG